MPYTAGSQPMIGPGEVIGLDQAIAYAEHLAVEAAQHGLEGNEGYRSYLAIAAKVGGAGLATAHDMQEAFAAAAAAAGAHAAELGKQRPVQEAYDQAPGTGDKEYLTGDGGPAAGAADESRWAAPAGDDEIRPQWPGHKPPRRWEWMVRAHRPGDRQHVMDALPSVDLASDQALRAWVQDALRRYDWVQLHHWYSGSELTFHRRPDGSVEATRRQLNPTAGAPGHRR